MASDSHSTTEPLKFSLWSSLPFTLSTEFWSIQQSRLVKSPSRSVNWIKVSRRELSNLHYHPSRNNWTFGQIYNNDKGRSLTKITKKTQLKTELPNENVIVVAFDLRCGWRQSNCNKSCMQEARYDKLQQGVFQEDTDLIVSIHRVPRYAWLLDKIVWHHMIRSQFQRAPTDHA